MGNERFEPETIEEALSQIGRYARENGLSPRVVCDLFSAGMVSARLLAPGLLGEDRAPSAVDG